MTIDRPVLAAGVALATWIAALAAVTAAAAPTTTVLLVGPPAWTLPWAARAGAPVVDLGMAAIRVRVDGPGAVWALYREGAMLVLPAPDGGCFTAPRRG